MSWISCSRETLSYQAAPQTQQAHNNICNATSWPQNAPTVSSTQTLPEKRLQRALKCVACSPPARTAGNYLRVGRGTKPLLH
eukprot:13082016-Alexandrium_andersonii.AAC.1